jgi:Tfp pilus assembly protein FimT
VRAGAFTGCAAASVATLPPSVAPGWPAPVRRRHSASVTAAPIDNRAPTPPRLRCLQRGATVVELAIVVGIAATLLAAAAPDLSGFVANRQLHAASDNLRAGLRQAQIEAIKRQAPVELVLTDDAPDAAAPTPAVDGRNWVIRAPLANGGFELIQSRVGSSHTPRVRIEADRGVFAFDMFGRLRADSFGQPAPSSDLRVELTDRDARGRPLRVMVRPAGSSLSCDPRAADGAPFACS